MKGHVNIYLKHLILKTGLLVDNSFLFLAPEEVDNLSHYRSRHTHVESLNSNNHPMK